MYPIRLLHLRRLHHILFDRNNPVSYPYGIICRYHVHRFSSYKEHLLWSWSLPFLHLLGHRHANDNGREIS